MMNCKKCGFNLADNQKFCPNCGAKVEVSESSKKPKLEDRIVNKLTGRQMESINVDLTYMVNLIDTLFISKASTEEELDTIYNTVKGGIITSKELLSKDGKFELFSNTGRRVGPFNLNDHNLIWIHDMEKDKYYKYTSFSFGNLKKIIKSHIQQKKDGNDSGLKPDVQSGKYKDVNWVPNVYIAAIALVVVLCAIIFVNQGRDETEYPKSVKSNAVKNREKTDYNTELDSAEGDAWDEGEVVDTFGYPIMYYDRYWEDIELLKTVAAGKTVANYTDYDYYTIPGYDGLIFYLSDDALYGKSESIPYGVFTVSDAGTIGEAYVEPVQLTRKDYENADFYRDDIIEEQGRDYGFDKMGWIDQDSYDHAIKRLETNKKQMEYEEAKEESKQAALDNGYVPGGYSYEDIARYVDDYIGFKVSWKRGVVMSITGDFVTVCVDYDILYGTPVPNYDRSFILDYSQATLDNGKPLVDDYINFEGTITGMDEYTNYIEIKADSIQVSSY